MQIVNAEGMCVECTICVERMTARNASYAFPTFVHFSYSLRNDIYTTIHPVL